MPPPVRSMMYAFGDVKEPANDTVDVMEEILMEYLVDVVSRRAIYFKPIP
jgi:Transcription initiation factor IID, 18kD subunit